MYEDDDAITVTYSKYFVLLIHASILARLGGWRWVSERIKVNYIKS